MPSPAVSRPPPIPLLLFEVSLPPLRVTLTHFILLSYERALRLPTSFPISDLARLGVKPRLCRSSWRALASTHPLMLPSTCSREALLACPPCPPWNLPSFTVESTLSTPCSRSDPPLTPRCGSRPPWLSPTLTLSLLMIWCFGQTALFLFLLVRAASAFLPTALSVALRPVFPFRQAQYAPIFPLKSVPFCTLFAGLGSTNKSAISLLFFYYLTLTLSSPLCPFLHLSSYLKLCGRSGRSCLLSFSILLGYNGSTDTHFYRGATWLMSWPDGERCLRPPQSLVVCRIHSCLISDWRHTVSSKFFNSQVPSISTEELVVPRHARCVLSRLSCNKHSLLLGSFLLLIGRIENPSCSVCEHSSQDIFHLILHCPATDSLRCSLFGDSLSLYDLWS